MSNIAYPYPNLMPWVRGNSLWEYSLNKGDFFDFKNGVDNWDYYSSIEIKCKLIWDIKEAFKNANLYPILNNSKVVFLLTTGSGQYGIARKKVFEYQLNEDIELLNTFIFNLKSNQISNIVKLRLIICTNEVEINGFHYRNGSILYDESANLELEGNLARLPVSKEDLSQINFRYKDAIWYVSFGAEDFYETFTNTYHLYLNSKNLDIDFQLKNNKFLVQSIKADTIATIIRSSLLDDDLNFDYQEDYPEFSLGFVLKNWLKNFIEGPSDLQNLIKKIKSSPNDFNCECQSIFCD